MVNLLFYLCLHWQYPPAGVLQKNESAPLGKSCSRNYSTTLATSNLVLHLRNSHGITRESLEGALPGDPSQTTFTKSGSFLEVHNVLDDETKAKIMTSVVDWVIDTKQSFSSVESVSFKQMTNALNWFWPGCSRRRRVAITCDGWSTRTLRSYFVITLHWIDETWMLRECILDFKYFPPPHDQWSTMSLILESLVLANLHTKIIAATTNNASEMIPAFQHLRDELKNKFSKVQVLLGAREHETKEVPGLDVENRWNTMFIMIDYSYSLMEAFQSLANMSEHYSKLVTLTSIEWRVLKCFKDFLAPAYETTILSSGRYATLSNQPLVFESLKTHCQDTINCTINSSFTAPESKDAARELIIKLKKYQEHLTGPLPMLALALDLHIRSMLIVARRARAPTFEFNSDRDDVFKEITDFLQFTKTGDESCDDALIWWAEIGRKRFPRLSLVARETLMCMGSSVPSESAFSDSGAIATAERNRLCDTSIETTMKLRSWKRLFNEINKTSL
ncbi:hypothetical protein Mp_4g05870 [Marchantia polymorpha subsp. ruderalis]|uniref:HAT C-terminal dimerisation domain-containing protein n=2 Tax=Marchantia polymorpha TaxID=3197 RepID=A0AAF6B6S9_MARPO|nr:hypothetical protein MARPO_0087s0004 [Marchantia polymorpha]BBN07713.1 hypothetical protein Mp_4g05870 [Marchantia polymorpha subsp. ruderalis]|eukprot:PTQ33560.1 hypothetical protein MARPO_0087s0004 [Marchantia polymorpha]